MKFRLKQTKCLIFVVFRDATFAQSGSNSRFLRDFFAQNGDFVQCFVLNVYFSGDSSGKSGAGTQNFGARIFFFRARNSFFGARMRKFRYRNFFAADWGSFFPLVGVFSRASFPCHFVGGIPVRAFPPSEVLHRECLASRREDRKTAFPATL